MNKELKIQLMKNRAAILESNGKENQKIVAKLRRQIRNLEISKDAE